MVTAQTSPGRKQNSMKNNKSLQTPKGSNNNKAHHQEPSSAKKRSHHQSSPLTPSNVQQHNARNSVSRTNSSTKQKQQQTPNYHQQARKTPSKPMATPNAAQAAARAARQSATPSPNSSSFAAARCFKPPTADALPAPPTSWTGSENVAPVNGVGFQGKNLLSAFVESLADTPPATPTGKMMAPTNSSQESFDTDAGQHLKVLLKVQ